ncbi:tetratricopeptide repeat-containing sulfotransferase family protein [Aestuariivirga sp.]|uniref:tetratricopeptide repeat-containing sulfotransferase family protein n=1 Tax=Aestuariivirga sp. TaxID=2650926 RepID=UPI0039E6F4F6
MDPKSLEAEIREILRLYQIGQADLGLKKSKVVHRSAPQLAITNYCVGHGFAALKDPATAIGYFLKAVELAPKNGEYLVKLGLTYLDLGDVSAAQASFSKAQKINPNLVNGQWALGIFYASIDRFDEAAKLFKNVIAASSTGNVPAGAFLDWCRALVGSGQLDEAKKILRELLNRPETRPKALASLADIEPFPLDSTEYLQIDQETANRTLSDGVKGTLLTAKARCLGAAKAYEEEFRCLAASKTARGSIFKPAEFETRISEIIRMFDAGALDRARRVFGLSNFKPIFVVGLPRSGTTLTERILARHGEVGGAGELSVISLFLGGCLGNNRHDQLIEMIEKRSATEIRTLVKRVEETMRYLCPGKERIVDKMPDNFLHIGWILALFPEARIVHCYRNPADNFLSGFKASLSSSHSYFDKPEWFSFYYRQYVRLMRYWYGLLPGRIHSLRYEDLVTYPEKTIRGLLAHCDLPWQEACLEPEQNPSRIQTASVLQARAPINTKSVGGWKRYSFQLQPVQDELGDMMPILEPSSGSE